MRLRLLPLLLLLPSLLAAEWYPSDPLGRIRGEATDPDLSAPGYLLERTEQGAGRTERLFVDGELVRERSVLPADGGTREEIREAGEFRVLRYRGDLPISEEIYREGELDRRYRFQWRDRRLVGLEVSDADGLVYRQEYRTDPEGRLRTLLRFDAGGDATVLQFGYDAGGLDRTWVGGYREGTLTEYDGIDIVGERRMDGAVTVARIERRSEEGVTVESSYDEADRLVGRSRIDAEGRLIAEESYRDGRLFREREYRYAEGHLVESVTREPGRLERHIYRYSGGALEIEELYVNRRLVRRSYYDGDERVEEFYRRGETVLRRRYLDNELVEETRYDEP